MALRKPRQIIKRSQDVNAGPGSSGAMWPPGGIVKTLVGEKGQRDRDGTEEADTQLWIHGHLGS